MLERLLNNRLKLTAAVFLLLITYPITSIASRSGTIWGIPRLFVYLAVVWVCIIFLLFIIVKLYKHNK
jgi:TRAP-type C4-dicarboxylate transport system permease small subunit